MQIDETNLHFGNVTNKNDAYFNDFLKVNTFRRVIRASSCQIKW